jgi:hypothetical protein
MLALMVIIYEFYNWIQLLKALVCLTLTMALFISLVINGLLTLVIAYVTQYYLHLKITNINQTIADLLKKKKTNSIESIKSALFKHNGICEEISDINKISKSLYFTFVFVMIPSNLLLLHQYLFEDLKFYIKIAAFIIIIIQSFAIFLLQFYIASISPSMHKPRQNLLKLQWKINGWPFRTRTKIKLLTCFERLSSDRKIGISIGSLAVMTFPLFYKVNNFVFSSLVVKLKLFYKIN